MSVEIDYEDTINRIADVYKQCSKMEQKLLKRILQEVQDKGYSQTLEQLWLVDFKEVPVSINEFISSPLYMGSVTRNGDAVYPFWKKTLNEIFNAGNKYNEVIFSGATRIGKTSTAVIVLAYMLYRLMLYRNPHEYFKKKEVSKFTIAFANITKDLAAGVAYREFFDTLKECPWFDEHGSFSRSDRKFVYYPEGDKIEIIPASDSAHVLGMQLWGAMLDEVNFARAGIKDINIAKQHMKSMYDTANARITGTFKIRGEVYGKIIVCSSKNSDSDFLSGHIETQLDAGNTHMFLVDQPQWEVLPKEMFSSERFYITVGDRYKRGFVVPKENEDEAHLREYESQGYELMQVPVDFLSNFRSDYDIALRDIAGRSVVGAMGFITQESITPCVAQDRVNPFYTDIIVMGVHDNETLERNFHMKDVPDHLKRCSNHIHIDFAETSDHIGISSVCQDGTKVILDTLTEKKIVMPFYRQVFQVAIAAPRGDRMSFQKVINFIVWLRRNGFKIDLVTTDQYQSSYVRETLNQQGFETDKISVDRSEDPYIGLRNLLQDQRIELIKHQLQEDELVHLQRLNGRIDHPPQGNGEDKSVGKDNADALCGAVWTHIMNGDRIKPSGKNIAKGITAVNGLNARRPLSQTRDKPSIMQSPYVKR